MKMPKEHEKEQADALASFLRRPNEDGTPRFDRDLLDDLVPAFALGIARAVPDVELPVLVMEAIGDFAIKLGLDETSNLEAIEEAYERYFDQHPILRARILEVEEFVRTELPTLGVLEARKSALRFLGEARFTRAPADEPPPEGAVRASPLARFTIGAPSASKVSGRPEPRRGRISKRKWEGQS